MNNELKSLLDNSFIYLQQGREDKASAVEELSYNLENYNWCNFNNLNNYDKKECHDYICTMRHIYGVSKLEQDLINTFNWLCNSKDYNSALNDLRNKIYNENWFNYNNRVGYEKKLIENFVK